MTLHYGMVGNKEESSECIVTKETRNYIYFAAGHYKSKYRYNKETQVIEALPYKRVYENLYLTFD